MSTSQDEIFLLKLIINNYFIVLRLKINLKVFFYHQNKNFESGIGFDGGGRQSGRHYESARACFEMRRAQGVGRAMIITFVSKLKTKIFI